MARRDELVAGSAAFGFGTLAAEQVSEAGRPTHEFTGCAQLESFCD